MTDRFKRCVASYEFVDHYAESPDVYSLIVASTNVDLRSEIEVGSDDSQHISPDSPRESLFGNPKVNDFNLSRALVVEDVFRFNVSMENVVFVQVL